jgi:ribosomal protein L31
VPAKERYVDDEGREYPLVNLETTSDSHPFYTDRQRTVGNHDQIEKFARRFGTKVTGASKQEAAKDAPESTATGSVNSQASTSRQSGRRK